MVKRTDELNEDVAGAGPQEEGEEESPFDPADYREGQPDPLDTSATITEIVAMTHEFVIFIDNKNRVVAHFPPKKLTPELSEMYARLEILQHRPTYPCKEEDVRTSRRLIATALQSAYYNDTYAVKQTAALAEKFIDDRKAEVARRWNVQTSTLFVALVFLISAVVSRTDTLSESWSTLGGLALFGMIGAFFSMLLRLGKVPWDASAGPLLHGYEAVARMVVGFTGGLLVAIAGDAGLLFSFASHDGELQYRAMSLACFVAGFSERLVPNFVARFESQLSGSNPQFSGSNAIDPSAPPSSHNEDR